VTTDAVSERREDAAAGGRGGGLGRGTSANLAGTAVSAVANLAFTVVVTRGVGRHQAGELFTATSLFLLLQMTSKLGSDTGATYFVARSLSLDAGARVRGYLRALRAPVVVATVVSAVVLAGIAAWWRRSGANTDTAVFVLCLVAFVPFANLSDIALAATRGFGDMRATVLYDKVLRPAGQLALVAVAAAIGAGVWLPVAWGVPYAVAGWLAWKALGRRLARLRAGEGSVPADAVVDAGVAREFWRFSAPRALASAAQTIMQRLDIVLVAAMKGPLDAAVYTAATRFLTVAQMVNLAISQPLQPRLSGLLAVDDRLRAREIYQRTTGWLVLLSWPLLLVCAVAATWYLRVFGSGYDSSAAVAVVVILSVTMLLATLCGTVDMLLIMAGRTKWNLANTSVALVVLVGLDVGLIPTIGIVGAAIGWAAAIAVNNLAPLTQVYHVLRLHPFGRATGVAAVVTGVAFGVVPVLAMALVSRGWPTLLVALAVGGVAYLGGLWRWRRVLAVDELLGALPGRRRATAA
jgi:O-antigen/teichoic acid export membrane protein